MLILAGTIFIAVDSQVNGQDSAPGLFPVQTGSPQVQIGSPQSVDAATQREASAPARLPDVGRPLVQGGFPKELILPPPGEEAMERAGRFVEDEIDPEIPLSLVINRPKILRLAATPTRVYVPNEEIIRTEVLDQVRGRELAITGVQAGTTTLTMWFEDAASPSGQSVISYLVRVFEDPILARPLTSLAEDLNRQFPNSYIELEELGGRLIVRGQAYDAIEMGQILQILVGARGVRAGLTGLNRSQTVSAAFNFSNSAEEVEANLAAAEGVRQVDADALAQAGIVNLMRIPGEQQVMLRIQVAEVDRTAARSIGLNFEILNSAGTAFAQLSGGLRNAGGATPNTTGTNLFGNLDGGQVMLAIDALRTLSLA
ncbi:MAG: pilus assembly protein N-terminal domain-containing protein, partial [Pirellulales bacterium]|nr:pilus assembly protein N-terminal domain-containing protein [Pirellulales bacterium]